MPIGTDYRQTVVLALESQGADQLTIVRDAIRDVQRAMATVQEQQREGGGAREYLAALGPLVAELNKLKAIESEITSNLAKEVRDRIDALARQERAAMDLAEREKQAAGDALRARIDAYARAERAAMDAAEREKGAAGEALRARVDAYAREEQAAEQAAQRIRQIAEETAEREKMLAGDILRTRIDMIARAEARQEQADQKLRESQEQRRSDEQALQAALGAMEQRKHDNAAEEVHEQHLREQAELQEYLGRKTREAAEAEARAVQAGIDGRVRGTMAAREHARVVLEEAAAAERARIAFEETVVPIEALANSAKKVQSDQIDKLARDADRARKAFEATVISTDQLSNAAKKFKSDQIDQQLKTTVMTTDQLRRAQAEAAQASKRFGYSILNVGHAIQDAQYGVGALLNNIPLLVQAFGGSAGLAGGVMIAAVALDTLSRHSETFKEMFVDDFKVAMDQMGMFDGSVEGLKEKLKELNDKPVKTRIDYSDIERAEKKLRDLTEAQAAFERLRSGKSEAAQKAGQLASKAIIEFGGGDDFEGSADRIARAAAAASLPPRTQASIDLEDRVIKERVEFKKARDEGMDPDMFLARAAELLRMETEMETDKAARNNAIKGVRERVGRAGAGYTGDIAWLRGLAENNAGAFKVQGVDLLGLQAGLAGAAPERVFEHERRKMEEQKQKAAASKFAQAQRQAETEQQQEEREDDRAQKHLDSEMLRIQTAQAHFEARGPAAEAAAQGKAQRERDRLGREAPKVAEHTRDMGFAQDFQRMTGANDAEANVAGKQIGNLVEKGVNPAEAMNVVFNKMMLELTRMRANEEAMLQIVGPATMALHALEQQNRQFGARVRGVQGMQNRMGNQRPTRNITFGF